MPQLIGLALAGVGIYAAYHLVRREMRRIGDELDHRKETPHQGTKTLVKDPETGVYRPDDNT